MLKNLILLLVIIASVVSCNNKKETITPTTIVNEYYKALDKADVQGMKSLLTDSLITKESDYEQTFSKDEYIQWLQWDAVFNPTYEVLEISEEKNVVKVLVSKIDKRIAFLHEEPIVTAQFIQIENEKITNITTQYITFNDTLFVQKRDRLVHWIDQNHPQLNGFIYDQTQKGGQNYLKAIKLFQNNY